MRQRIDECLHERDVHHRHLVQNDRVALERIGHTAGKHRASAARKACLEQPVNGFRLHAGQVRKTFCRAAGRRSEQRVQSQRLKHLQDAAHRGRFAGARAAGQDNKTIACSR